MSESQQRTRWMFGGGATVLLIIALPLWNEFRVHGISRGTRSLPCSLSAWPSERSYFNDTFGSTLPK
jgi:hypothetical protein